MEAKQTFGVTEGGEEASEYVAIETCVLQIDTHDILIVADEAADRFYQECRHVSYEHILCHVFQMNELVIDSVVVQFVDRSPQLLQV